MARMIAALRLVRRRGAADEALVDLDLVERRLLQIAERAIAGAEVVERKPNAELLQLGERLVGRIALGEEHALGDLELEPLGSNAGLAQMLARPSSTTPGSLNCSGERLTATRTWSGQLRRFLERGPQHPFADLADQAGFLGQRNELGRRDRPAGRMLPADQRFEPGDLLAGGADDRLVMDRQLAALDRLAKIVLEQLALGRLAVHRRFVEAVLAAAGGLGRVEREVGIADQRVGAGPARVADGDADRGADRHLVAFDHVGPRDLLDQRPGERFQQADVDAAGKHRLELVAAETPDLAVIAHHRLQPLGDLAQQRVADRVAERVVDVLEPIEIDHEQRAALLAMGRVAQRFVERLAHHRAVRQSGQRVEPGEARDLLLGPALLGEVGADAAEAEEAAAIVEDRVARQRPVHVLLAGRANDHVGEGEARRQVEAQRLALFHRVRDVVVDRQQIGELAAEQLLGLALEILGELLRNVGQVPSELVSQNQPRPLFSNSSTKCCALRACASSREPLAARRDECSVRRRCCRRRAPATRIATPTGISGDWRDRMRPAIDDDRVDERQRRRADRRRSCRIAMPGAIAIGAAAIGARTHRPRPRWPNHVHRTPADAR